METPKLVLEAFESGLVIDHVIVPGDQHPDPEIAELCETNRTRLFGLSAEAFTNLSDAKNPQPALAVVESPSFDVDERFQTPNRNGMYLVLVDVSDPGNVGTLIRTAEATGCAGVIVTPQTADVLSPKVVRASAGSVLRVPVAEVEVEDLFGQFDLLGATTLATAMDGESYQGVSIAADKAVAIVLGSEAHGVPATVSGLADHVVSIPMHGKVESLNVATTGAVLAFDMAARRSS